MKSIWLMSAALFACANEAPVMETTLTSAGMHVDVDPAAAQIGTDSCNRQLSCGHIGKGHLYADRRACRVDVDRRARAMLAASCSSVDATRLAACLNEIRDQRCVETGNAPLACTVARLCL